MRTINKLVQVLKISIGVTIISVALNFFLLPHQIASAGVGAIGHLLELQWAIDRNLTVWVMNLSMLALTYLLLDRQVFSKVFLGSLLFPVFLRVVPLSQVLYSHRASLFLGSALFSLGVFFLYKSGSSNGGVTIPPIILERYFSIPTHRGLLLTNLVIVLLNFYILGPLDGLFAMLSIVIMTISMQLYAAIDRKWLLQKIEKIESNQ